MLKKGQSLNKSTKEKQQRPFIRVYKQQEKEQKKGPYTQYPTAKLAAIKTSDPFSKPKGGSPFLHIYDAGMIPCKVFHGSVSMRLQWDKGVELDSLNYETILVPCFEGLIEEKHPYNFIAFNVIKDLLEVEGSQTRVIPMIKKLVWPLVHALSSKNEKNFENSVDVVRLLSDKVGSHLNPNLKSLITPMVKHMKDKKVKDKIFRTLVALQENGGPEVRKIIKSVLPTFTVT